MVDIESPKWQKNLFVIGFLSFIVVFVLAISFSDPEGCFNCEPGHSPFTNHKIKP